MSKRSLWARVGSLFSRRLRQQHAMEEFRAAMTALKEAGELLRELREAQPSTPASNRVSATVQDSDIVLVVPTKVGAPLTIRISAENARKLAEALKKSVLALEVN